MIETTTPPIGTADREITITRVINAPRDLVFEAWTKPEHVARWWGPDGFTLTTREFDFQPGGVWRFIIHGPDGTDYPNEITYDEIIRPELISYDHGGGEDDLNDAQFHATITFEAEGNKTRLTMNSLFNSAAERDHVVKVYHAIEGGHQHLARLEEFVETGSVKN